MLEFILSKTILIVFSLAVLITSGSMVTSFYSEQEIVETSASFQQLVSIIRQMDSFDGECLILLDMNRFLGPESTFNIGNGSMILFSDGKVLSADLSGSDPIIVLDQDGSEATTIEVARSDVLVLGRKWAENALRTVVYIENVEATFSTAPMNRSTSSTVL